MVGPGQNIWCGYPSDISKSFLQIYTEICPSKKDPKIIEADQSDSYN